jgi:hypothetical protein
MLGVADGERSLATAPRLREIAEKIADQSEAAARQADFRDPPRVFRFPQERRRQLMRRVDVAAQKRRGPLAVSRGEALREVVAFRRELCGARRRLLSLRRRSPSTTSPPDRSRFAASGAGSKQPLLVPRSANLPPLPCRPSRSPCRDGRSPPGRLSGAAPDRPPCPTIRWRDRRDQPQ